MREVSVEEFQTTKSMPPEVDGMGNPLRQMGCDGACTADGAAGCAWFDGTSHHQLKMKGRCTNNQAEYMGLVSLLQQLVNEKFDGRGLIMMDSQLVVSQMDGTYSVRNEGLKPYYLKAKQLTSLLDVDIMWVPRSHPIMGQIDKLAKEAARC